MRLIFAGTPDFAAMALDALYGAGHEIALVLTQPDRPTGRGLHPAPSAVKKLAGDRGLPVSQPQTLKDPAVIAGLEKVGAEAMVVAAYGLIVPPAVLSIPHRGCINIHASLLPRWRGAAPIQRAILAGDDRTGISIMQMDAGLDTGPVLLDEAMPIAPDDTAKTLHDRLAALGARLIVRALESPTEPRAQDPALATYAAKLNKAEAVIDWNGPAVLVDRRIRAFNPVPGASTQLGDTPLKVWRSRVAPASEGAAAGTIIGTSPAGITVACGGGTSVELLELQRAGGKRLPVGAFLAGCPIPPRRASRGLMLDVQRLALGVVGRVLSGRSLDAELHATILGAPTLSAQDRGAVQDITFGTLRFLGQIDAILGMLLERPLKDERVRHLLRIALFQLVHTRAAPHAIVDHAVRSATSVGKAAAKGLVNAVLRNFLRRRDSLLAAAAETDVGRYSHPQWWIDSLRAQYPECYGEMLDNANRHPPLTVRVNERRVSVEAYCARLTHEGMPSLALGGSAVMIDKPVPVERLPGFSDGCVSVQDAAAQYAAVLLDPKPGQRVLDACAAPGGKTAHMLERADIDLTALDNDDGRLARVASNLTRLSLSAKLICGDAAHPESWWDGTQYDAILADVPCSASGVVRRHPDIKWLRRPSDIARFAERQRELLDSLWRLLARDGKLLYATCSVFREENYEQIRGFLDRHGDARRLTLPAPHTNAQQLAGQILPDERHDGFFYALLQKIGSA